MLNLRFFVSNLKLNCKLSLLRRMSGVVVEKNENSFIVPFNQYENNSSIIFPQTNLSAASQPDILSDPHLSDEDRQLLKLMIKEYEIWKYADVRMPDFVTNEQWKSMLQTNNRRERIKMLTFYATKFRQGQKDLEKERRKKSTLAEKRLQQYLNPASHIIYGQGHNALLRRLSDFHLKNKFCSLRAQNALIDGTHLVFDLSFLDELSVYERNLTVSQLVYCVDDNRLHRQPAALIFTGVNFESNWYAKLDRRVNLKKAAAIVTDKSYLDLYPKQDLVYLSPDGNTMDTFDSDKIHIIGAFVDKPPKPRLTLAKAKREGIVAAKLPLDKYVKWETGSKYLCLNHVLNMLLDVNMTGNWYQSIDKNVPKRKLRTTVNPFASSRHSSKRLYERKRVEFLESLVADRGQ